MKLGVSMYCYVRAVQAADLDLPGFCREAKRIGAEGVELLDFFYKDPERDRQETKALLSELDLPVGVFSVGNDFAQVDCAARKSALDRILAGIDDALHYDAKVVRVFAGDVKEGVTFEQAFSWVVEGLSEAADAAHAQGVRLALENHGKLAGRSDQVRDIVQAVRDKTGHDALGANPDTGNFLLVGQNGEDGVADVADLAHMVHFKDFEPKPGGTYSALDGTEFEGTIIGEGAVDLGKCVASLRAAGFEGWLNLEYEGVGDPISEVAQSLANTRRFVG